MVRNKKKLKGKRREEERVAMHFTLQTHPSRVAEDENMERDELFPGYSES